MKERIAEILDLVDVDDVSVSGRVSGSEEKKAKNSIQLDRRLDVENRMRKALFTSRSGLIADGERVLRELEIVEAGLSLLGANVGVRSQANAKLKPRDEVPEVTNLLVGVEVDNDGSVPMALFKQVARAKGFRANLVTMAGTALKRRCTTDESSNGVPAVYNNTTAISHLTDEGRYVNLPSLKELYLSGNLDRRKQFGTRVTETLASVLDDWHFSNIPYAPENQ